MSSNVASAARAAFYRPVAGVNVRALPLLPEQAFILSRVDGNSDERAIAMATGIPAPEVCIHLQRLEELGAVQRPADVIPTSQRSGGGKLAGKAPSNGNSNGKAPQASQPAQSPAGQGSPPPPAPADASQRPTKPPPPSGPRHPEIDEALSISLELQNRILDLSTRLPDLNHFELLGVERKADRTAIKRAYFSMIGTFHPDTYFGKKLGGFTRRMEKIFQRLTEAHDVLSNPRAREEYEGYLGAVVRTRGFDSPSAAPPSVEDLERLLEQAERDASKSPAPAAAAASMRPVMPPPMPPPLPPRLPPAVPPAFPAAASPATRSLRPLQLVDDPVARRQALARKLGLTSIPPVAPAAAEEARSQAQARHSAVAKELHQRYEHRKTAIRDHRVQRFIQVAEEAVAAGNAVSAMNSLKIARTLANGDAEVEARIEQMKRQLGGTVSESYLQRARYEESNGHHEEAARSYTRAARGSPSPDVLRSAAECYLKAGTELRLAGELAREAVQMAPDRTDLRLSLAKIYEAAGMPQSAVRELERALALTPGSDRIKQWLKRLERGGV